MKVNTREYREMRVLEVVQRDENEEERKVVTGYASTFNDPYVLYEDDEIVYTEEISPDAFNNTDMRDVIMQYDHAGRVFARTRNNTLQVTPDEKGLFVEADLGGTELGRQLYDEIRGGYTDKMSFGFIVSDDEVLRKTTEDGREGFFRTITGIAKLFDVSAVSLPANEGTSIGVATRGLIDGAIEEVRAERLEAEEMELKRKRTAIKAKALLGGNK